MSESQETSESPKVVAGSSKPEGTPMMGGKITPRGTTEILRDEEEASRIGAPEKTKRRVIVAKLASKKPPLYVFRTSLKPQTPKE